MIVYALVQQLSVPAQRHVLLPCKYTSQHARTASGIYTLTYLNPAVDMVYLVKHNSGSGNFLMRACTRYDVELTSLVASLTLAVGVWGFTTAYILIEIGVSCLRQF